MSNSSRKASNEEAGMKSSERDRINQEEIENLIKERVEKVELELTE